MKLHSLQALRAIAALLVVVDHALLELTQGKSDSPLTHIAWRLGETGVSTFFVISGFIMVHICWNEFGKGGSSASFFQRRVTRIVPLYWFGTIIALGYHRVSATHGAHDGLWELLYSLAFIPYRGADGTWTPILPQGWTLNYEMMFYFVFAFGLWFQRGVGLLVIGAVLGCFVIGGPFLASQTLTYLASPIVLFFVLGMAVGVIWNLNKLREPAWLARSTALLEPLGDASYSLYIIHGLALTMLLRLWVHVAAPRSLLLVPVSLFVAALVGWLTHRLVERRLLRLTNGFWNVCHRIPVPSLNWAKSSW